MEDWETCKACGGDEGHFEGDNWIPCEYCDGQGGWPIYEVNDD